MTVVAACAVILAAAALFVGGIVVLGGGAWMWARAFSEIQRARVHRISADTQEETLDAGREALDEIDERRRQNRSADEYNAPSDEDFYRQILSEREPEPEITTTRNEGIEEESGITPDRIYVPEEA